MSLSPRHSARTWIFILLCAAGFLAWTNYRRIQRVEYVTNTDRNDAVADPASPTGYAGGKRWLIVPEHNNRSYQWITETQQMLAQGEWRVRHVDYDNAPFGREVHAASPYRWWLGLIARCNHTFSGQPLGLAAERAALWAEPLLHLLLLVGTVIFVARQFGPLPGALLALGLATLYPFAGGFLPGIPDDHSFGRACALWSILPLLAAAGGARRPTAKPIPGEDPAANHARAQRRMRRLFFVGGIVGGLGLWINVSDQAPILAGTALGGVLAGWIAARGAKPAEKREPTPWRTWALGGATTCLAAYLIEYFPAHLDLRLQVNHPLYGLAWLGIGELLALMESWSGQGKSYWNRRRLIMLILAIAAVAALPVTSRVYEAPSLLSGDPSAARLSWLPNGVTAKSFFAWVGQDGLTATVSATALPLLLLVPALWLLARRQTPVVTRVALALALGPVLVALALALAHLAWWNLCDVTLLALVVATASVSPAANPPASRDWRWIGFAGLVFLPGMFLLLPPPGAGEKVEFSRPEVEALVERGLAHWIADHADPGGAVILVPPDRTTSWCFHGGLRGLGSANWENRDGLQATVRIVTATTAESAWELIQRRGVTHIILPSWDSDLDAFARWSFRNPEDAFVSALHHWALPPWLRPLPYKLPANIGFDDQSVAIFKVTDESNRAAALSRLAEYFVESQQPELAASMKQALQLYPTDLGVLVALAQVEKANGNTNGFAKTLETLLASIAAGSDRSLVWDRRVSLAIVLAQSGREDLAREQVRRCLDKINEERIRSLTTGSLFRLQILGKAYGLTISDPQLRARAVQLLPPELRSRL